MVASNHSADTDELKPLIPTSHHPLLVGDILNSRYEILEKLGCSNLTTIWRAKDSLNWRIVMLKVFKAEVGTDIIESQVVTKLAEGALRHKGRKCVSLPWDVFTINGANGTHKCSVYEIAGCTLEQSKEVVRWPKFSVNVARAIVAQVLLGMEYIHSCGVVHGALQMSNIIFKESDLLTEAFRMAEFVSRTGRPKPAVAVAVNGECVLKASEAQPPRVLNSSLGAEITDARVKIKEFSASFLEEGEEKKWGNTPMASHPPELIFGEEPSQAADIWTLGCTIFEILGESSLFQCFNQDWDNMIAELVVAFGILPKHWWEKWAKRSEYFLPDGSPKPDSIHNCMQNFRPLSEKLRFMGRGYFPSFGEFEPEEMRALNELLRGMLAYLPQERITAKDASNSRWMEHWGLKAMREECGKGKKK